MRSDRAKWSVGCNAARAAPMLWTVYPAKNYSASGLFDLLGIDLAAADPTKSELLRHTMPGAQMIHAMEVDAAAEEARD